MKDEIKKENGTTTSEDEEPLISTHRPPLLARQALLSMIGIGPGDLKQLTLVAQTTLLSAEVVIGYKGYIDLIRPLLSPTQEIISSPIGSEMERARQAVDIASMGQHVALVSSGDIGIYAMASPVFEVLKQRGWQGHEPELNIYPGISAMQAAASRLGAPLGHDFCTISLSDLLTPWSLIERRIHAVAWGDFVVALYNPRSQKRNWQLDRAIDILLTYRADTTPVAIARNITRAEEQITLTTLAQIDSTSVDMFSLVLIGNSQSYRLGSRLVTPRGYLSNDAKEKAKQISSSVPSETLPPLQKEVYPIMLTSLVEMQAVVIGGGVVGERKIKGLLLAGIETRLISPQATSQLQEWAEEGRIQWIRRPYQAGDLEGSSLVFAATDQRDINAQVAQEAKQLHLLCNVADQPQEGNFHVPAIHRQPGLLVSVSSAGEDPHRARKVRDRIATWLYELDREDTF